LTWIRRKSQDVQIREPQHVKPHTTTVEVPQITEALTTTTSTTTTTTTTTTTPKPTTTNPPTTTPTTEPQAPTKAPASPTTQAPTQAPITTDSITNYVQPQTEPPSNPNKQTLAMISDASTVIDFYEVLPTNKFSLIKQLPVPYAMTKPQSRPFIIYNPEFQAIEIMGDVHDHKNTEHGWVDISSGRYTRSNYNRFEGREQFAGVWTEKLGMLIFGGHKNKAKWRKPLERYSTCVLQVTYPRNMYTDWKYMPNLKTGRTLSAAVHHEDRVYVSGGRDSAYALESIEMMDLQRYTKGGETKRKLTWQVLRPMNQAAKQHSLFVFNDILFSAIGERDRRTVEGYNMNRQSTVSESSLSLYNHVSGAAFVNDHTNSLMLVAGGGTANYVEVSEYDESSETWGEFDFMFDPGLMKKQDSRPFLSWTHFTHNYA